MVITTVLAFVVARERGGWNLGPALIFLAGFMLIDLGFLGSNLMTIPDGGWLPLAIGSVLFTLMVTWRRGTVLLQDQDARTTPNLETVIGRVKAEQIPRVPGTAIFLAGRFDHARRPCPS
jgi:KUP system potassium uptake protein